MDKRTNTEREAIRDAIDARRWRWICDHYVRSIEHRTDGKAAFTIALPRIRENTVEDVVDRLMKEANCQHI